MSRLEYLIETSALALIPVETGELTHLVLPLVEAAGGDFSADATIIDGAVRRKKGTKGYRVKKSMTSVSCISWPAM
jgi:hypothetical protein